MSGVFLFFLSAWIGYLLFLFLNDPIDNLQTQKKRLPTVSFKNIEILPYFRIHFGKKTYHVHHWLLLSVITIVALVGFEGFQHQVVLNGAAIGGIIQGLRYPDRFQFKQPRKPRKSLR